LFACYPRQAKLCAIGKTFATYYVVEIVRNLLISRVVREGDIQACLGSMLQSSVELSGLFII
jgi:hypothetical protein